MSCISSYSLNASRDILESIRKHGLATPSSLQKQGIFAFGSQDQHVSNHICVNSYGYTLCKEGKKNVLSHLIENPVAGISAIALERKTDCTLPNMTFGRTQDKTARLAADRLNSTVLFEIDLEKLDDSELKKQWKSSSNQPAGENSIFSNIPLKAIKRAFVPQSLVPLFKSIYPKLQCVELTDKKSNATLRLLSIWNVNKTYEDLGFDKTYRVKVIETTGPDYQSALGKVIDEYVEEFQNRDKSFKTSVCRFIRWIYSIIHRLPPTWVVDHLIFVKTTPLPLTFHLVRLIAPSDEELIQAKVDKTFQEVSYNVWNYRPEI